MHPVGVVLRRLVVRTMEAVATARRRSEEEESKRDSRTGETLEGAMHKKSGTLERKIFANSRVRPAP